MEIRRQGGTLVFSAGGKEFARRKIAGLAEQVFVGPVALRHANDRLTKISLPRPLPGDRSMIASALLAAALQIGPIPTGDSKLDLDLVGTTIETFVYKPKSYRGERMIIVCHGTLRNADEYSNDSRKMAERFGALVVAPKFDEVRFPNRLYHRGGC